MPVLRDVADAGLAALAGRLAGEVLAAELDGAGDARAHRHDRLDELGLTVALDAGDAEHLALVDVEGDVVEQRAALRPGQAEVLDRQQHLVGDGRRLGAGRGQLGAHHQLGQLTGGHLGRQHGPHRGAAPDHGDLVGDGEDLVQLVADEDDRDALLLQLAQVAEQLVDLLRHQDGGGLVEDHDAGAAVEHLEDLHPLAGAHAELLDQPVGLDAEAVGVGDALDLGAGVAADSVQLLGAEDDVLEDGEVVGEHEVLEHHADAGLDRVRRGVQGDLVAVDLDRARVRRLHAVEDLHQRRLAGAVLPHDRVDGAAPDVDVDVVVGDHAGEPLADPTQADGDRRRRLGRFFDCRCRGRHGQVPPLETSGGRAFRRTLPNWARCPISPPGPGSRTGRGRGPGGLLR